MTGRRSHGRLSALNGVVHQGNPWGVWRNWVPREFELELEQVRLGLHAGTREPVPGALLRRDTDLVWTPVAIERLRVALEGGQ